MIRVVYAILHSFVRELLLTTLLWSLCLVTGRRPALLGFHVTPIEYVE